MLPSIALIKTEKSGYEFAKKIGGIYPLERNIKILIKSGIKKVILDLSEEERSFYSDHVARRVEKLKDGEIVFNLKTSPKKKYVIIPSNLFMQISYFKKFTAYFRTREKIYKPIIKIDQFLLGSDSSYNKAIGLIKTNILENTGGYIARNINKKASLPMSFFLVNFGIHPNYLTIINMLIGITSGFFLLMNSYLFTVLGGFLFQLASVMDGVDGEVAKISLKDSKIGGRLDTIGDNSTLIFFISAASYQYFVNIGGILAFFIILIVFAGFIVMLGAMVRYLRRYSESGSLVAYDKEFLQKLPKSDPFVYFAQKMKYFFKKEFFSYLFFAICLTGKAFLLVPIIAFGLLLSAIVLVVIDIKYFDDFKKISS